MYNRSYKGEILKNLNGQVAFNQVSEIPNQREIYKNVLLIIILVSSNRHY